MKINRKLKKIFRLYNVAIAVCVILILISIFIIFRPEKKETAYGIEVVDTGVKEEEEITEEEARSIAKKQFKKLGEKGIDKKSLEVLKIQRKGEEYYYISSSNNTLEIKIKGGEVTRINSATVNE